MDMKQLHTHKHRNADLMEEHMLRIWMHFERENKIKEVANAKLAADLKAASDNEARLAAAAADAKKRVYIARVDAIHTQRRLDRTAAIIYFRDAADVLMTPDTVANRGAKIAILEQLELYDIEDKVGLLLASGLPALIKNMSKPSVHDDKDMAPVRMSAADIMALWRVAIISTPTIMRAVKQEDPVPTKKHVRDDAKCGGHEPDGDRSRLSKKFKRIASGK